MRVTDRLERLSSGFYDLVRSSRARDDAASVRGFGHLRGRKYALLVTYKRSGEGVPTPVWFGLDDRGHAFVRTGRLAAKARRIRNDPRVKLAPCTVRGTPIGAYAEGTARLLPPADEARAESAIQGNYGLGRKVYERSAASFEAYYIEISPV